MSTSCKAETKWSLQNCLSWANIDLRFFMGVIGIGRLMASKSHVAQRIHDKFMISRVICSAWGRNGCAPVNQL
jgi:hypothetical protein